MERPDVLAERFRCSGDIGGVEEKVGLIFWPTCIDDRLDSEFTELGVRVVRRVINPIPVARDCWSGLREGRSYRRDDRHGEEFSDIVLETCSRVRGESW